MTGSVRLHGLLVLRLPTPSEPPLLPYALSQWLGPVAPRWLHGLGYGVEWCEYAMPHQVRKDEIADRGAWIKQHFV